ncbi:MAG: Fic family protein, partial [Firmicutes bacterium]|nr:Fic family protein [Bacillota bacterium]
MKVFTEQEAIAKIQSIKSSNAIEGIVTSDDRIEKIVRENSAPLNHTEAEIAGYRDALNQVHQNHGSLEFCQRDILKLHELMMDLAGYEYGGQYKTSDNVIVEEDASGNRRVRFRPTPAAETAAAMEQLELA